MSKVIDFNGSNPPNTPIEQSLDKHLEEKILQVFKTYPTISPSMLQITLGSSLPTAIWKPILEKLINEEKLYRYAEYVIHPNGRRQLATILSCIAPPADV